MSCIRLAGERLERTHASKQWEGGTFHNATKVTPGLKGNPLPVLGEYFFGHKEARIPRAPLPIVSPLEAWRRAPETGFRATWLGHSSVLLEMDGARVLTDPVFGDRASPLSFAGPKRFHPVPASLEEIGELDAVLLSHDHYDHLCATTMRAIGKRGIPVVTALGVGARLEALGVAADKITELDWLESARSPSGRVTFHARPAQHFSGRSLSDRNRTLWASWVIETAHRKVFFSGDTGLTEAFAETGKAHGPFDLVMLEVGAFHPSWGDIHLGPENALTVFDMLGGGTLLPVHWSTFNLALHAWDEPAETLVTLAEARGSRIVTPRIGAPTEPERVERANPWWRSVATETPLLAAPHAHKPEGA